MESKENSNLNQKLPDTNIWGWKWSWISLGIILFGVLIVVIIGPNKEAYELEQDPIENVDQKMDNDL